MATNKKTTGEQVRKTKDDNSVVYKVMVALLLLCGALLVLRYLRANYVTTVDSFFTFYNMTPWMIGIGLAVAAAAAVVLAVWRKTVIRLIFPWVLVLGLLAAMTGFIMRYSYNNFPMLYFFCLAILAQYIIFQLYRWEFFCVSLSTVAAGGLYFVYSGFSFHAGSVVLFLVLMLILAGTALLAFVAAHHRGRVKIGKRIYAMFPPKFSPIFIYIVDVLWLLCTIAVLFLGSLFAYYCMFGAIAVEFIAAVYYTFQLN